MNIYIIRNNRQYGPYDEQTLLSYVNSGQILLHDKAIVVGESQEQTVKNYLKCANLKAQRQDYRSYMLAGVELQDISWHLLIYILNIARGFMFLPLPYQH